LVGGIDVSYRTELERLFEYEFWANRRWLARLREIPNAPPRVFELFAHIHIAQAVWRARLRGEDSRAAPISPKPSLGECAKILEESAEELLGLVRRSGASELDRIVCYTNQTGKSFETSVRDILWQLMTHAPYHRGQIALLVREFGEAPVDTGYITWVREQDTQQTGREGS
jgi:uncharacterized damage-inducible protein DinB